MADGQVLKLRLTAGMARRRTRELAENSSNIIWTRHIRERMVERGIDSSAVLKILQKGDVDDPPTEEKEVGEWKFKVTRRMANGRVAGVVTLLIRDSRLRLLTAEWEDYR